MNIKLIYIYLLSVEVYANITNNLIIDYFRHKRISSVTGYSCNNVNDNALLTKILNQNAIYVALNEFPATSSIGIFGNTTHRKLGIFVDTRCYNSTYIKLIFSEATNNLMYGELHKWLILGYNLTDIVQIVNDRVFGFSTDFVTAIPSDDEQEYKLFDAYNLAWEYGRPLNITFLGYWTERGGLNITLTQDRFSRRSNSHGLILRGAFFKTVYKPPQVSVEEYFQDHTTAEENLSKFGFILLRHLSDLLNFELKCIITPEWEVGDSVGPVIRAVINNEADIMGSPMAKNKPRTYWVKYVHQAWPFRTCFIFRNPQPKTIKFQEITRPFDNIVWYLLIVFTWLAVVILAFVTRFEWTESECIRLSHSFLITIGAMSQQGTDARMESISTRIAFFFIMLFSLLMYNYYSAGVVSARFNEPIVKINDSLSELSKLPLRVASEYMTYFDFHVKKNDWETKTFYTKRWLPLPEKSRFMSPEEGLPLIKSGEMAYHTHPDVAYPFIDRYFSNREICELTEVNFIHPNWSGFAVRLNSSIIEMARIGFTKILEVGLRYRQVRRWQYKKPTCLVEELSVSSVNMYEFAPHLLLLFLGYVVAIAICIVENIIANQHLQMNQRIISAKPVHPQTVWREIFRKEVNRL